MRARIADLHAQNRPLATKINSLLGNDDDSIDGGEALRTIGVSKHHAALERLLKTSFGQVPATPAALIDALKQRPARTTPERTIERVLKEALGAIGDAKPIGDLDGNLVTLSSTGFFARLGDDLHGPERIAGTPFAQGELADRLYAAARLVAPNSSAVGSLDVGVRQRLITHLGEASKHALEMEGNGLFKVDARRLRHGAAGLLVALAKEGNFPQKEIDGLFDIAATERHRGLTTYLYSHLKKFEPHFNAPQKTKLAELQSKVLYETPPYEEWFANNNHTINVRHYLHDDYYDLWVGEYRRLGFREEQQDGAIIFTKSFTDQSGANQPTEFRVVVRKTEEKTFRDMADPNVHIEWYSGHSNLGGNVENALRHGPEQAVGTKWIIHWMCRGQQIVSDVLRRFPNAHYTTTSIPPSGGNGQIMIAPIFQGIASRAGYHKIRDDIESIDRQNPKGTFMLPNDPRFLSLVDYDGDGITDGGPAALDPLHDAVLEAPAGDKVDLKPRASPHDPEELRGEKIMHGVNFANTIFYYHNKYGGHLIDKKYADKIISGGWFGADNDDPISVGEQRIDDKDYCVVQANSRYADQTADAIGAMVQYGFFEWATKKKNGGRELNNDEKLAGLLFAGEYLSYMYCTNDEANAVMRALSKRAGLNLGFDDVRQALDADGSGYVTPAQVEALTAIAGSRDRIG